MQDPGKSFIRYAMFPGIIPRLQYIFASGFYFMASVMAVIYANVGLLPRQHPYLLSQNFGRFGVRHVVFEAGKNLEFSRKNIDKILLHFSILIGLFLLCMQLILLGFSFVAMPAFAGTWGALSFWDVFSFSVYGPEQDFALIVLDRVFGVMTLTGAGGGTGFFQSCYSNITTDCIGPVTGSVVSSPTASYPTPLQQALHGLFRFYSVGLFYVALLVILYYIIAIVGETITSGTPFGKRFNKAWVLPRVIVFFALIAPISTSGNNAGINGAQLITMAVAKYGSNMATHAWLRFLDGTTGTESIASGVTSVSSYLGQGKSLIAKTNVPEVGGLAQFFHLVHGCMYAQKIINNLDVKPYLVRPHTDLDTPNNDGSVTAVTMHDGTTAPYHSMGGTSDDHLEFLAGVHNDLEQAIKFSRYETIVLRFGYYDPPTLPSTPPLPPTTYNPPGDNAEHWGFVEPTCGELHIEITSLDRHVIGSSPYLGFLSNYYYSLSEYLTFGPVFDTTAYCQASSVLPHGHNNNCIDLNYTYISPTGSVNSPRWITSEAARSEIDTYDTINRIVLNSAPSIWDEIRINYDDATYANNMLAPALYRSRGWAGAAIWYNKIADLNGLMTSAMHNVPRPFKYPMVMEAISEQHQKVDANFSYSDRFNPRLQDGKMAELRKPGDLEIASFLYSIYEVWNTSDVQETVFTRKTGNVIVDSLHMILGTSGLLDIRENEGSHPLAMLSSMGKAMVDASLRNLFIGVVGQGIGEIISDDFIGQLGKLASGFAFKFAMIGLSIGFVLYYVLPLMPFIYFFFAFGNWIKSIFEAMVAMPLWALAHLKLDGEGLPGPWASNGYFLLLEILIRPVLIIVGLVAAVGFFSAVVDGLHDVHTLLVFVTSGYDIEGALTNTAGLPATETTLTYMRGPIDQLFYTIVYVIMVYMLGLSSFKLIDAIPNNILRWMGVTVSTFQDHAGDPAGELASKMYRGTNVTNMHLQSLIGNASSQDLANSQMLNSTLK